MTGARFPHSETPGSTLGCQLPGAYRRLPRPSSAPGTKASTVCPKKLEHNKKNKMLAFTMQFSKHGQPNPPPPPNHQPQPTRPAWYGGRISPQHPGPPANTTREPGRPEEVPDDQEPSVPSGPNSVPTTTTRPRRRFPLPTTKARRY